ncbi:MAG: hypothetical protein AB1798_20060 [Spirochaetota bacterium]
MKIKTIFILFNIVIIFSFLIIYFMPLIILGWDFTTVFWSKNWFLPILFVTVLGILNTYFILNWGLFKRLERQDWDGLIIYLEDKIYNKKHVQNRYIRILINAYLVKSKMEGITRLEVHLRENKPAMVPRFALQLGIPHLLKNSPEEMENYFKEFAGNEKSEEKYWISWNYAFALLLQQKKEEAKNILDTLILRVKEPILNLLILYLMDTLTDKFPAVDAKIQAGKTSLRKRFTPGLWQKEVNKNRENIQIVILAKLVREAGDWLFKENGDKKKDGAE